MAVFPPAFVMAAAVRSRSLRVRPATTVVAPKAASFRAMDAPMPFPDPVTNATFHANANSTTFLLLRGLIQPSAAPTIRILTAGGSSDGEGACLREIRYL